MRHIDGLQFTAPRVTAGRSGRVRLGIALALVALLAGALVPQLVTGAPSAKANGIPAALARAIHARFGSGPIGLGRAPLVSGILRQGSGWQAKAASPSLDAQILSGGGVSAHLSGHASIELRAVGLSSGSTRAALPLRSSSLNDGRLSQRLGALDAVDEVTRGGLEQSFTLSHALSGSSALTLAFSSSTRWRVVRDGSGIVPATGGYGDLAFAGLRTTDARGRLLKSHFATDADGVRIVVATAGATFPLTIDPTWTTTTTPTATLTNGMSAPGDELGYSVALAMDGKTALIGAPFANNSLGAAYVFHVSSEGSWATSAAPAATLSSSAGTNDNEFGSSVALSSDGTTALIGSKGVNDFTGAAYVFHVASEATWVSSATPTATLTNGSGSSLDEFGSAVALSSDGKAALIGAGHSGSGDGSAYVFHVSSESSWSSSSSPTATLTAGGARELGDSVAFSSDGTTALLGGDGAAYLFHATAEGSWSTSSTPAATLTDSGATYFGGSVALSSDGTTALIGADNYGSGSLGKAYVFRVSAESSWASSSTPVATLSDSANSSEDDFGYSVSLSSDGTTALIGAERQGGYTGAAYVFHVSTATSWSSSSTPTASLTNSSGASGDDLGSSLTISSDGTTAVIGALGVNSSTGSAYEFHASAESAWASSSSPASLTNVANQEQEMGTAVALSADGTTAIVGAAGSYYVPGAAYVYHVSSEGDWTSSPTPVATLTAPTPTARDYFGVSVALSGDGDTAVVGAMGAIDFTGAAYVFHVASESSWASVSSPSATLSDSADSGSDDEDGSAVAVSGDGTTVLVGDSALGDYTGAVYVYHVSSAASWSSSSTPPVTLAYGAQGDRFGASLALSADGTTALIGAWGANGEKGVAYIFQASAPGSWVSSGTPTATLRNGSGAAGDQLGASVALSADGSTALIGAYGVNYEAGAAYVFHAPSESSWVSSSTPNATLTYAGSDSEDEFGAAVALSGDGRTALVGAPRVDTWSGAAYAYQASAEGAWSTTSAPLATLGDIADSNQSIFGDALALPSDGLIGMVSAWGADTSTGATYIFSGGAPPAAQAPQVTTDAASAVSSTAATLNATINDEGSPTTYEYEYGTTTSFGSTAPASGTLDAGSGDTAQAQPETVSGLTAATEYYFRVCANNTTTGAGTADQVCGSTLSFTTSVAGGGTAGGGGTSGAGTGGGSGTGTGASGTGAGGAAGAAAGPPSIAGLSVTPGKLSLIGRLVHGSCKPLTGANRRDKSCRRPLTLRANFTLSTAATMTIVITGELSGRSVHGHCVAATKANRKDRACARTLPEGRITRAAVQGANELAVTRTSLKPGKYELAFTAAAGGESSRSQTATITITD